METNDIEFVYRCVEEYGLLPVLSQVFPTLKVFIPVSEQLCKMSIKDLDLSVRSYNALMAYGAKDIGSLIDLLNSRKLGDVRNLGAKSTKEIQLRAFEYSYEALDEKEKKEFLDHIFEINCK
ncbi:MAG: hypothetical protein IJD91_03025 [Clostridia bacterium]|nr:hypothetical protein [Clostridia bacterium]